MARIDLPEGDDPEIIRVWKLRPDMAKAVTALTDAVYEKSRLPARERECIRMRIAQINNCQVCLGWRIPPLAKQGVTEEMYAHVAEAGGRDEYSVREKLAVEYAERFALDHLAIDETFFARLREHFGDDEILDMTICIGDYLAFGRLTQVLQLDHVCEVTASSEAR
jgi:AhpD family alkylhydroperoxidase